VGKQGPVGPQGPQGLGGRGFVPAYASYVSNEPQSIARGGRVFFTGHLGFAPSGVSLNADGATDIRILAGGVYHISYSLLTLKAAGSVITLLVNGNAVPSSREALSADAAKTHGFATLFLKQDDLLSIGIDGEDITLDDSDVNAFIDLFKIAHID
jgi:hypothetical protein